MRIPHTFVLLAWLLLVAAAATYVIPAGEYSRITENGRTLIDPASFRVVPARPARPADVALAYPRGLAATSEIVFYIFIIGGAFGVLGATGAIDAMIEGVVAASRARGELVVPALVLLFSFGGGTIGIAEETLPFLPSLVILARRFGYDEITGGAIALAGAGAGFSGAFLNPFTIGVGQGIAGLPLFSGLGFRLMVWVVLTAVTMAYVARYARRIRRAPDADRGPAAARADATLRQRFVILVLVSGLLAVVVGAMQWGWGLTELSGLFLVVAAVAGPVGGLGADRTAEAFVKGAAGIVPGALVVGLARGVLVIFDQAHVTDTILHAMATMVQGLPASVTVVGIYATQVVLSFLVPSASGQAALSLPILAPLGDLVGVTRQTSVLAYQFGDGFSNVLTPTQGYFMAGLALINVPWTAWARFMLPLFLLWCATGLGFLLLAHAIRLGPF